MWTDLLKLHNCFVYFDKNIQKYKTNIHIVLKAL